MATTPAHVPLTPGVNWPLNAGALIRAEWRRQAARNVTAAKYRPEHYSNVEKLTEAERAEIRSLYAGGTFSQRVLAKMFEVSQTTIWSAIHHERAAA